MIGLSSSQVAIWAGLWDAEADARLPLKEKKGLEKAQGQFLAEILGAVHTVISTGAAGMAGVGAGARGCGVRALAAAIWTCK